MIKQISFSLLLLLIGTSAFAEEILESGRYEGHVIVSFYAEEFSGLSKIEKLAFSEKDQNLISYFYSLQEQRDALEKARAEAACQATKGVGVKTFKITFINLETSPIDVWDYGQTIPNPLVHANSYYGAPLGIFSSIDCNGANDLAQNQNEAPAGHRVRMVQEKKTRAFVRAGLTN
jgi:hypothetical protein